VDIKNAKNGAKNVQTTTKTRYRGLSAGKLNFQEANL
jgi:hypothetical protein